MRINLRKITYFLLDVFCAAVAVFFAVLLRFDMEFSSAKGYIMAGNAPFFIALVASVILFGVIFGRYTSLQNTFSARDVFWKGISCVCSVVLTIVLHEIFKFNISMSILLIFMVLFFVLEMVLISAEIGIRFYNSSLRATKTKARRALIVGAGRAGSMLVQMLMTSRGMESFPVAVVDDDPAKQGMKISGVRVCGEISDAVSVAKKVDAEEIIIAIPSATAGELKEIFEKCRRTGLAVKFFGNPIDFHEFIRGSKKSLKNLSIEDLLFRDSIKTDMNAVREYIRGKTVLVTGGAGSIGSEICRQVLEYGCKYLVVMDINENGLFFLRNDLLGKYPEERFCVRVGSVRDKERMNYLFARHKFDVVFHAAAHKHVPLMEDNPFEAVKNNVFGTKNTIECCIENKTERFVLISTDKAVNPTNVMGATKRAAELLVQKYNGFGCVLSAVRFGNVLGSNGSVIPIFQKQIEQGGPVTVTHRDIMRYFMTIPEAVSLVLNAGITAKNGETFVLDMGQPVSIYDLACNMIELAGLRPHEDIEIEFTGLRPGEKMFEELKLDSEKCTKTQHDKIFVMHPEALSESLDGDIEELYELLGVDCGEEKLKEALFNVIGIDFKESVLRGSDVNAFEELV
ncbi:MAG: polysaccharide biosynthesis protein [Oscillospiraceae bacterium]|nr:polysaccharide biosynthesis protein [Oscillospiraceae bacterium]